MMAKTQVQIERVSNLSPSPTDKFYSETDKGLAKDQQEVQSEGANPEDFPSTS